MLTNHKLLDETTTNTFWFERVSTVTGWVVSTQRLSGACSNAYDSNEEKSLDDALKVSLFSCTSM